MTLPNIVDQFSQVVAAVSSAYGQTVHFRHGHMLEVANIVQQMVKDPDIDKRYPIIALQHDFEQDPVSFKGTELKGLKLYIITLSRPEYIAEQRKELIFKPILYPIRDLFIQEIARSGYFEQQSNEEVLDVITLTDRYYWGSSKVMGNDANMFLDWVDSIEIGIDGLISYGVQCGSAVTYPRLVNALTDTENHPAPVGLRLFFNFDTQLDVDSLDKSYFTIKSPDTALDGSPDLVTLSPDLKTVIANMPEDDIVQGNNLTLDIAGGSIYTVDGVELKPVTGFYIQNNVQL